MARPALALGLAAGLLPGCVGASGSIETSMRPQARVDGHLETSLRPRVRAAEAAAEVEVQRDPGFDDWIGGFRSRAVAEGIPPRTFDRAFRGVRYNDEVIARDRNQSEFTSAIWEYLDSAVSRTRIDNGRSVLRRYRDLFGAIEAHYGVEREVVAAVWGLESSYGDYRGDTPVIEALATLAHDGRRGRFFEKQLIGALKIIASGDVAPSAMTGSWAGAMGHTQFIPTSYLAYAVDFRGTGKRDIWSDDPTDALASTAAYLKRHGWTSGQPWGVEVVLPRGFDHDRASGRMAPERWRELGVRRAGGGTLPDAGPARLFLPAGSDGPAFLTFANFEVIKRYNASDAYATAVGYLSDRLAGKEALRADWPRDDRPLDAAERAELQRRLTARGFDTRGIDGKIGPNTLAAVREYQSAAGLAPDGYISFDLLRRLR